MCKQPKVTKAPRYGVISKTLRKRRSQGRKVGKRGLPDEKWENGAKTAAERTIRRENGSRTAENGENGRNGET